MSRVANYVIIMSGVMLLFYFTGLTPQGGNPLLELLLNPSSMSQSSFVLTILVQIGATLTGLAIGYFTKDFRIAAFTVIVPALISMLWNFVKVFEVMYSVNEFISVVLFAPLFLMFFITMVELWGGLTS